MINQLNACYFYSILYKFLLFSLLWWWGEEQPVAFGVREKKTKCKSALSRKLANVWPAVNGGDCCFVEITSVNEIFFYILPSCLKNYLLL